MDATNPDRFNVMLLGYMIGTANDWLFDDDAALTYYEFVPLPTFAKASGILEVDITNDAFTIYDLDEQKRKTLEKGSITRWWLSVVKS